MSENDKWAWFSDDDPAPGLFRPETSASKADSPGLRLDVAPPGASKTPAGSASVGKAAALHVEGKTDAAIKELLSAIEGGEHLGELYSALGHLQFEQQKFDEAAGSYQKAAQVDPKHKTAYYNLGVCKERLERWQEAMDAFQKALDADSKRVEAQLGLAVCLLQTGSPERALDAFEQCLKANADLEPAQFGKAVALHLAGKPEQADALY